MKIRFYFLTLFLTICFSSNAQNGFQEAVISYLSNNGTVAEYNGVYDAMLDVLKKQFSNANVPESDWDAFKADKPEAVNQVVRMFSSAYRKYFAQDDISKLNAFFSTEAGRQMRLDPDGLNKEQRLEVGAFYNSPVAKKLDSVKGELTRDISQISEYWSRDLFNATMNSLTAKGYSPQ
jgi:hypothetical protein